MKRNALCDGVHKASQTGGRERLGQPGAGQHMNKHKKTENRTICKVRLVIAIISFICGVSNACIGIFLVPPFGMIVRLTISIIREMLILCGTILGISYKTGAK